MTGVPLLLNGAGLRTRFMLEVYVIGLYVRARTTSADAVLDAREPRRVRLVLKRAVDAQTIWENFNEGSAGTPRVAEGDVVEIDFASDGSGVIRYRGEEEGAFSGADLSRALLKIWLGAKPVQSDLKQALLGG